MKNTCKQLPINTLPILGVLILLGVSSQLTGQTDSATINKTYKSVVGVVTDSVFANSTIVHTKVGISDAQVLKEIEEDYSLGDEVRITVLPPPKPKVEKVEKNIIERVTVESGMKTRPPSVYSLEDLKNPKGELDLRPGSIVRTGQLQFEKDKAVILAGSETYLENIYEFMKARSGVVIEVGGHTNTLPDHDYCLKLSESRARAVVGYLVGKGIASSRLKVRGYGKTQPLLNAQTEAAHKMNQRVELKIIRNDAN
jgi:outer membrane protein OmpA-like peptidoglycan-associated protein